MEFIKVAESQDFPPITAADVIVSNFLTYLVYILAPAQLGKICLNSKVQDVELLFLCSEVSLKVTLWDRT